MIQIQMTFPSIEAATEFMARGAQMITEPAAPAPSIGNSGAMLRTIACAAEVVKATGQVAEPEKKKPGRPANKPTQATVVAPSASATTATDNGASVQPATPPEAGATGGESEKQLPLAGVDPAPPAPTAAPTATETEMKDAAKAVIAKLGQIEGMNKAREVLERVAGVKLIRDVPADKYGAVKAAMDALTA